MCIFCTFEGKLFRLILQMWLQEVWWMKVLRLWCANPLLQQVHRSAAAPARNWPVQTHWDLGEDVEEASEDKGEKEAARGVKKPALPHGLPWRRSETAESELGVELGRTDTNCLSTAPSLILNYYPYWSTIIPFLANESVFKLVPFNITLVIFSSFFYCCSVTFVPPFFPWLTLTPTPLHPHNS